MAGGREDAAPVAGGLENDLQRCPRKASACSPRDRGRFRNAGVQHVQDEHWGHDRSTDDYRGFRGGTWRKVGRYWEGREMILVGQMVWSECENGLVAEIDEDRRVVLYDNNGGFWMELHNGTVVTR